MIYKVADMVLDAWEINMVLDKAITLCPAMKRNNAKIYPANAKIAIPSVCVDEERTHLVAGLLNALAEI